MSESNGKSHAIQGGADGMCGIYSLVNFLAGKAKVRKAGTSQQKAAFFHVLKSAETLDILDAAHIFGGFFEAELIDIFNETTRRLRLPYVATPLSVVTDRLAGRSSGKDIIQLISNEGGAAVVLRHGDKHWVLASGISDNGKIEIEDSGHNPKYRAAELSRLTYVDQGVAILPKKSTYLRA